MVRAHTLTCGAVPSIQRRGHASPNPWPSDADLRLDTAYVFSGLLTVIIIGLVVEGVIF